MKRAESCKKQDAPENVAKVDILKNLDNIFGKLILKIK